MKFLNNFTMLKENKKLVTHNGSFHADDVFACATLCLMLEREGGAYKIIRTRDENIINEADFVFDVGGTLDEEKNRFDHHQKGGAGRRENGIEYSSFGLIWKKFGDKITNSKIATKILDERLVQIIDAIDNGINISSPVITNVYVYGIYDIVTAFHPSYKEENPNFDDAFLEAVDFAKRLLIKEIEKAQDQESIQTYVSSCVEKKDKESKILILDEYVPRVEIEIEMVKYPDILYVVALGKINSELWRVLATRDNMHSFETRKKLPESWAGLKDKEFEKVSGIEGAIFCHRALFMAVANSRIGAIKLAEIALDCE